MKVTAMVEHFTKGSVEILNQTKTPIVSDL